MAVLMNDDFYFLILCDSLKVIRSFYFVITLNVTNILSAIH